MDTQESVTAKDNSLELQKVEKIQGFIKNYKEGNRLFLYVGIFAIAIYTTIFILSITLADIHGFWSTGILLVTIISIPPTLIGIKKIIKAIIGISIQEGFTRGCGVIIIHPQRGWF